MSELVKVQVIPMGKTANLDPNREFSMVFQGQKERAEYERKIAHTLPSSKKGR